MSLFVRYTPQYFYSVVGVGNIRQSLFNGRSRHTHSTNSTKDINMKYTEKWAWQKNPRIKFDKDPPIRHGLHPWMIDYRKKIHEIDSDEKAAAAIREYWTWAAQEWHSHVQCTLWRA